MKEYVRWLERCEDEALLSELYAIAGDEDAVRDRFYCALSFGTGGLRGKIGAGTNRMNVYTVGKATQGYADYLNARFKAAAVAIAYDNRKNSDVFARRAAAIFAQNGVTAWMYPALTPTPMLSFAVRHLAAQGGVVITASHNPAVYNGYKVYGPDGCQITDQAAADIEKCIGGVDSFDDVKAGDFDALLAQGMIRLIPETVNEAYLQMVSALAPGRRDRAAALSIVYTPLNGTGRAPVLEALNRGGFAGVQVVREQEMPDPAFPTCPYPNPEIPEALALGVQKMKETGAALLLATDPDCDRVGTAVWDGKDIRLMTGNEIGVLLMDYICRERLARGAMPPNPVMVKTIVTTEQARPIAAHYGVELRDVLTGFKYIGEQIGLLEKQGQAERFLLGFEESYGYLSGTAVRDKDGVNAALLICRMAADYAAAGMSLADALRALEQRFGFYRQALESRAFPGEGGMREMRRIMDALRAAPPACLAGMALTGVEDYLSGVRIETATGEKTSIDLPASNVLKFFYGGCATLVARPSGTEPKLKLYFAVSDQTQAGAENRLNDFRDALAPALAAL